MPLTCSSCRGHSILWSPSGRGGGCVRVEGTGPAYISQANTKSVKPSQAKSIEPSDVGDFDPKSTVLTT